MYCHWTFPEASSLSEIILPVAEPKSLGLQKQIFSWKTCSCKLENLVVFLGHHEKTVSIHLHHVRKVVLGKGAERILFLKFCSSLVISSCKWENLASSVLFQGKTYSLLEGSERSLRSRRLEVVGERENGCMRGSRTPVFSCAHYFQAPDTQAKVSPALTLFKVMFNTINTN